ncbi:MAG TPA: amidohydrolase family protein [candidate division Zixibacteria bacterium]|nr:amidohydrolase family protein [candidate division Zixibacteria bacterium]
MKSGFRIMDSDMHLREPADLWEKYMEPQWRDRAPRILSSTARSSAMVMIDGKILRGYSPTYRGGIFDASRIDREIGGARARGFDAVSQLEAMDREGLDVAALYPSIGLGVLMRNEIDPGLAAAIARAYNNWLHDFCQADPKRLKGVAMISLHDVTEAVKEATRAVRDLGFVGVFARPEPLRDLPWHSRYYDTLWSCLEELGVPIGFHSAAALGELPQAGDRFGDNLLLRHVCAHPMENMLALVDVVGGGVLERHPKLKVAFLECYCGWLSFLLHRLDNAMAKGRFPTAGALKPSEYFKRQCWISTEHERELPMIIELLGDDRIVFSTDYPHGDSDFPHAVEEFLEIDGVTAESRRRILWDNCARLYGLDGK